MAGIIEVSQSMFRGDIQRMIDVELSGYRSVYGLTAHQQAKIAEKAIAQVWKLPEKDRNILTFVPLLIRGAANFTAED